MTDALETQINIEPDLNLTIFDRIIEYVMMALFAFLPLAIGPLANMTELVIIIATGIMAVCFISKFMFVSGTRFLWTWAYIPLLAFILVISFQLIELPSSFVQTIAANTYNLKMELAQSNPMIDVPETMTLSMYPYASAGNLRVVLAVSVIFIIAVNIYRNARQVENLLKVIAIVAGIVAIIAMAQMLVVGRRCDSWLMHSDGQAHLGLFLNQCNFGQYMNLSLGAALSLVLVKLTRSFWGSRLEWGVNDVVERIVSPEVRRVYIWVIIMAIGVISIFVSLTWCSMSALLIAGGITAIMIALMRGPSGRTWLVILMILAAVQVVMFIGFEAVVNRFQDSSQVEQVKPLEAFLGQGISDVWNRYPLFGKGMGPQDVLSPLFDQSVLAVISAQAGNEYTQTAEEVGGVGLIVLIALIYIIWFNYGLTISKFEHVSPAQAIKVAVPGLGFGVLAVMIQSFSGFGQHLATNGCLFALFGGLIISIAYMRHDQTHQQQILTFTPSIRWAAGLLLIALVGYTWMWAFQNANSDRISHGYFKEVVKISNQQVDNPQVAQSYDEAISLARKAVEINPGNVTYHHGLNMLRWYQLNPQKNVIAIKAKTPQIISKATSISNDSLKLGELCSVYGPAYSLAGQLQLFVLNDRRGATNIQKGYLLSPYDALTCYAATLLDCMEGKFNDSFVKAKRAITLDSTLAKDLFAFYFNACKRPDLAMRLADDNSQFLMYMIDLFGAEHNDVMKMPEIQAQLEGILNERISTGKNKSYIAASLGYLYLQQEDFEKAEIFFKQALDLEYTQVNWRYNRAVCLDQTGQPEEAIKELKICLLQEPNLQQASQLLKKLETQK